MSYRNFLKVDLVKWVYGTVDKYQHGESWRQAWPETYREIGGLSESVGLKVCPREAAKTLYEHGRLKDSGVPFRDCVIPELWEASKNGTYAILATRLLRENPSLGKAELWREIQRALRREVGEEPAGSDQGGPKLTFQLWQLGLIVDALA